eukprot:gnl/Hemi2/14734_TR4999_c0_g7_i1.p2 gnl/Hemi2/14734_TR4999_c0_g7~~gnl/Hemi2/14734_TR4999_c0_g7_i1.p2  ORF type:complete len:223 (-),score=61.39 gnl/Hemi2/14734_TR4999_c0_g7_i1:688-1356(-)
MWRGLAALGLCVLALACGAAVAMHPADHARFIKVTGAGLEEDGMRREDLVEFNERTAEVDREDAAGYERDPALEEVRKAVRYHPVYSVLEQCVSSNVKGHFDENPSFEKNSRLRKLLPQETEDSLKSTVIDVCRTERSLWNDPENKPSIDELALLGKYFPSGPSMDNFDGPALALRAEITKEVKQMASFIAHSLKFTQFASIRRKTMLNYYIGFLKKICACT